MLLAYFLGEISPALTLLYLKIYDFFFLLSKYSSMLFIALLLGKIPPPKHSHSQNIYFSSGEISPELSLVSTIFSGPNFLRPEPSMFADVWLFLSILWYSFVLFTAVSFGGNFRCLSFLYFTIISFHFQSINHVLFLAFQIHNYFLPFNCYF